jgi:hypothetical protein
VSRIQTYDVECCLQVYGTFDILVLKSGKILKSAVFTKEGGSLSFDNDNAIVQENAAFHTVVGTLEYTLSPGTKEVKVTLIEDGSSMFQLGTVSLVQSVS